jgi:hypothetical protein
MDAEREHLFLCQVCRHARHRIALAAPGLEIGELLGNVLVVLAGQARVTSEQIRIGTPSPASAMPARGA